MRVCVDANVIVRLVAPSSDINVEGLWQTWQTTRLTVVAPTLLRYEVVNSFHRMRLHGNISGELARELVNAAMALPFTLYDDNLMFSDALSFAAHFDLKAAYDSHYLALSQQLSCELWTTDKKFFNAVQEECPWVQLVRGS